MLNNKESNGIGNKRTRSILPIPLALALLMLASPKLIADPPGIQLLRDQALAAEEARHAQERAEAQRQLRDTQEKARQQAEDIAALRKQLEASQQQKTDSFQQQQRLKALEAELQASKREADEKDAALRKQAQTDPANEKRLKELERQNQAIRREADLAKAEQRNAEQRLANERNKNIAETAPLPVAAPEPAVPAMGNGLAAIAAGVDHTCALTSAGGVKCWGYNDDGRLGDNSTTERHTPVNVKDLTGG